jgi:hypothetical protein
MMKIAFLAAVLCLVGLGTQSQATPSTTYWTPCTVDIQPAGVTHITLDTYSQVGKATSSDAFPTDFGLTWGANLSSKLSAEYGFDVLAPSGDPYYLNAKLGFKEGALSKNAPALQLGLFNFGTHSGVNNQDIVYLTVGKSLPNGETRVAASYYIGNGDVLRSSAGDKENTGYMVAADHALVPGRIVLAADFASGKNAIGGGGAGVYYYFTKDMSLLAGPVWFNDEGINGSSKLTVQLDINF